MTQANVLYPPGGFGAPKNRHGQARGHVRLPACPAVFSADTHISLPAASLYEFLPDVFSAVLMQYDDLAGAATNNIEARIRELREDGVDRELAFPNALLAMFGFPDKPLRERVFRIYNEYIADLQERSDGHFFGVGLINW